ncbi:hypothetical protein WME97_44920 [Sorangium sp. So ce367]|uniref:hypothetical protein n=1 Tax=Sorangium sp. So ce367 TaxID=3133305 RepID=UPI003F5DBA61
MGALDPTKLREVVSSFPRLAQTEDAQLRAFLRDRFAQQADISIERAQKVRDVLRALCEAMSGGDSERWDQVDRAHAVFYPPPEKIDDPAPPEKSDDPPAVKIEQAGASPPAVPTYQLVAEARSRPPLGAAQPSLGAAQPSLGAAQPPLVAAVAPPLGAAAAPGEINVTLPATDGPLPSALPFKGGAAALPPPRLAPRGRAEGEGDTLAHAAQPSAPALPFVKAAAKAGWDPERSLHDARPSPAAAMPPGSGAQNRTQALGAAPASAPSAAERPVDLPLEHYAALCVELEARPDERAAVLAKYRIHSEPARDGVDRLWAHRFQQDPAAAQRFRQLLAHYRGLLARGGR